MGRLVEPGIYYTFAAVLALSSRSLLAVQMVQWSAVVAVAGLASWLGWRPWHSRLRSAVEASCALHERIGRDLHVYDCR